MERKEIDGRTHVLIGGEWVQEGHQGLEPKPLARTDRRPEPVPDVIQGEARERAERERAVGAIERHKRSRQMGFIEGVEIAGEQVTFDDYVHAREVVRQVGLATRLERADEYQRAQAEGDMMEALSVWVLLSSSERDYLGLPTSRARFAEAWGVPETRIKTIMGSKSFNRDYLVNGVMLDKARSMMDEALDILMDDIREGGAPASKFKLLFTQGGALEPDEDRADGTRRTPVGAPTTAEDMASRWVPRLMATRDFAVLADRLGGHSQAQDVLRAHLQGALTEVFGGTSPTPERPMLGAGRFVREHFRPAVEEATIIED